MELLSRILVSAHMMLKEILSILWSIFKARKNKGKEVNMDSQVKEDAIAIHPCNQEMHQRRMAGQKATILQFSKAIMLVVLPMVRQITMQLQTAPLGSIKLPVR
jgi:hypothetical protein